MTYNLEWQVAKGLWSYFEFQLPDTPQLVAKALFKILEREGYEVVKKADNE
jgi:hypothetical protein